MAGKLGRRWVTESYTVARQVIYRALPHGPGMLPTSYEHSALPVVNEQLEEAGIRLAVTLNAALSR